VSEAFHKTGFLEYERCASGLRLGGLASKLVRAASLALTGQTGLIISALHEEKDASLQVISQKARKKCHRPQARGDPACSPLFMGCIFIARQ